ncbi:MAG: transcriptional regulator [Chlorobiaceae bacterium]|nr:transcriptional regulator [Chlorobiaceae bacterium]NTW74745.1 transcriptional regulator [Chlorobiaceae bacterium]
MDFECQFVCELREFAPAPALAIHSHTTINDIPALFDRGYREIAGLLTTQGLRPAGSPFARYFNMDADAFDVEFGFPVPASATGKGRVLRSQTPSGKAASCLYIGPYEEIEPAYDALLKWATDNGLAVSGEVYEIYLNDPASTPPDQLKTQVCLMLRDS